MYQRILVAVDDSKTSRRALDYALAKAHDNGAQLRVVHVIDIPTPYVADVDPTPFIEAMRTLGDSIREDAVKRMKEANVKGDVEIREILPLGEDIPHQIIAASEAFDADVIVVGTHGRRGFRRLALGSVAENCARRATRPVILIPHAAAALQGDGDAVPPPASLSETTATAWPCI
ncbi:universal stress protein [Pandoraea terrae]|uniref:Universal stress protein n=2 Tax=Pandoraea terrae TaxID=1537710 RepID=A0A5E4S284_9BURK|nr:universal stress protein [Pandoraea terrae]